MVFAISAARKAELSTELLDRGSTSGGVAAAAASDYEYRGQGKKKCFIQMFELMCNTCYRIAFSFN